MNNRKRKKHDDSSRCSSASKTRKYESETSMESEYSSNSSKYSSETRICSLNCLEILITHTQIEELLVRYQNPIRCAYQLLHKNLDKITFIINKNLLNGNTDSELPTIASDLADSATTLARILMVVNTIQEKICNVNKPLKIFEQYVSHIKKILTFVVTNLLKVKMTTYLSRVYTPCPYTFRRLECKTCDQYVTFDGCDCTEWTYDVVPSQKIQQQLLSLAEDGPTPSYNNYTYEWCDMKAHVNKIPYPKPSNRKCVKVKEPQLSLNRKESNCKNLSCTKSLSITTVLNSTSNLNILPELNLATNNDEDQCLPLPPSRNNRVENVEDAKVPCSISSCEFLFKAEESNLLFDNEETKINQKNRLRSSSRNISLEPTHQLKFLSESNIPERRKTKVLLYNGNKNSENLDADNFHAKTTDDKHLKYSNARLNFRSTFIDRRKSCTKRQSLSRCFLKGVSKSSFYLKASSQIRNLSKTAMQKSESRLIFSSKVNRLHLKENRDDKNLDNILSNSKKCAKVTNSTILLNIHESNTKRRYYTRSLSRSISENTQVKYSFDENDQPLILLSNGDNHRKYKNEETVENVENLPPNFLEGSSVTVSNVLPKKKKCKIIQKRYTRSLSRTVFPKSSFQLKCSSEVNDNANNVNNQDYQNNEKSFKITKSTLSLEHKKASDIVDSNSASYFEKCSSQIKMSSKISDQSSAKRYM